MVLRRGAAVCRASSAFFLLIAALMAALFALPARDAEAAGPVPSFEVTAAGPSVTGLQNPNQLASVLLGPGVSLEPGTEALVNLTEGADLPPAPNSPLPSFGTFRDGTTDLGVSDGLIITANAAAASFETPNFASGIAVDRGSANLVGPFADANALGGVTAAAGLGSTVNNATSLSFELEPPPQGQGRYLKFEYSLLITEAGSWNGSVWNGEVFGFPDGFALFTGGTAPGDNCAVVPQSTTYLSMNTAGIVAPEDDFADGKAQAAQNLQQLIAGGANDGIAFSTGETINGIWGPGSQNDDWTVRFLTVPLTCVYDAAAEITAGDPIPVEIVIGDLNDSAIPPAAVFKANSVRWSNSPTPSQETALTVTRSGSGVGTVTSGPAGINCGQSCSANFTLNSSVTLTASPAPGSTFTGWSGGGCSGTATCVVTMDQARSVNANFVASTYELSVNKSVADTGTGVVTSTPSGINCGTTCQKSYDPGTQVTLTATADLGSRFTGWTGACTNQQGPCTLSMTDNRVVTARFTAVDTYRLTVDKQGTGQGTVTSTPAGIDCGSTCESSFNDGEEVTLTASAAEGSAFTGWSGACTGTAPCQVTMDQARQVSATFDQAIPSYALSVTKQGQGTVTSNPSGINCGTACEASYEGGTEVTLTASASQGSQFTGWSGACTGSGTCQVTMSQARQVTATFTASEPPKLSITKYRPGPRRLNSTKIIRLAWVECESGTCQIDDAEVSFKARGKDFSGSAIYSADPFQAGERRLISTRVPDAVNERLTSRKSGLAILDVKASARNGELEEDVSRTVRQGLVRCPDSKCG